VYGDFTWEDWHTHRIDWVEGKSSWYVDGVHVLDKTYGVPTTTAYLVLNMWSDGGVWSGEMEVDGEARLEIEWIEMAFNTSGAIDETDDDDSGSSKRKRADSGACSHVCTVDDETPDSAAGRNSAFWSGLIAAVLVSVALCV
jgi:beta-glucanase (GH16 family)